MTAPETDIAAVRALIGAADAVTQLLVDTERERDSARADLARVTRERDAAARRTDDLLGEIRLYVKWHWVTSQLTTEQKEMWADAVDRWSARLNADDPGEPNPVDRWWRSGVAALGSGVAGQGGSEGKAEG